MFPRNAGQIPESWLIFLSWVSPCGMLSETPHAPGPRLCLSCNCRRRDFDGLLGNSAFERAAPTNGVIIQK
jgi:hypothetical protein